MTNNIKKNLQLYKQRKIKKTNFKIKKMNNDIKYNAKHNAKHNVKHSVKQINLDKYKIIDYLLKIQNYSNKNKNNYDKLYNLSNLDTVEKINNDKIITTHTLLNPNNGECVYSIIIKDIDGNIIRQPYYFDKTDNLLNITLSLSSSFKAKLSGDGLLNYIDHRNYATVKLVNSNNDDTIQKYKYECYVSNLLKQYSFEYDKTINYFTKTIKRQNTKKGYKQYETLNIFEKNIDSIKKFDHNNYCYKIKIIFNNDILTSITILDPNLSLCEYYLISDNVSRFIFTNDKKHKTLASEKITINL